MTVHVGFLLVVLLAGCGCCSVGKLIQLAKCSHDRATDLFIDSIHTLSAGDQDQDVGRPAPACEFRAFPCDSADEYDKGRCMSCGGRRGAGSDRCQRMGYHVYRETRRHGAYYLNTKPHTPYCARHHHAIEVNIGGSKNSYGSLEAHISSGIPGEASGGDPEVAPASANATTMHYIQITDAPDESIKYNSQKVRLFILDDPLSDVSEVRLRYEKNNHWLWGGQQEIYIDSVVLADENHRICLEGGPLLSGVDRVYRNACRTEYRLLIRTNNTEVNYGVLRVTVTDNYLDYHELDTTSAFSAIHIGADIDVPFRSYIQSPPSIERVSVQWFPASNLFNTGLETMNVSEIILVQVETAHRVCFPGGMFMKEETYNLHPKIMCDTV